MLVLIEDEDFPHYAHPLFWAPFVVVGGGWISTALMAAMGQSRPNRPRAGTPGPGVQAEVNKQKADIGERTSVIGGRAEVNSRCRQGSL
jgi:hypothetical protein